MNRKIKFTVLKNQSSSALLVFSISFAVFLLLTIFSGTAPAQSTGSSVVIYSQAEKGTDAEAAASYLAGQIGEGLQDKYPCVDWLDDKSLAAILDWERQRELLSGELDEEMMQNLAGAVGARYIIIVTSTTLPNGQTTVSAKVIDTQTGRTVANRMEAPADADEVLDKADAVTKSIMQDLSNIFKNQCEPHWTGTISQTFKYQKGGTSSGNTNPGAMETKAVANISWSDNLETTVEALLQPMSLGSERNNTMARVAHKNIHKYERIANRTATVLCRPQERQSYLKETNTNTKEIIDQSGQITATLPVYIYVEKSTGKYEIRVKYPALTYKRYEERSGSKGGGCEPEPFSETSSGAGEIPAGSFEVEGQVDPRKPDVLSGKKVMGDLENGMWTWTWNLRLVKPKPKK